MIAAISQGLLAFALFFGVLTIAPKAAFYFRRGEVKKALLYLFMVLLCAFFMVLAAGQSVDYFLRNRPF